MERYQPQHLRRRRGAPKQGKKNRRILCGMVILLLLAGGFFLANAGKLTVRGTSMEPALLAGDVIRYSPRRAPTYGALVVFTTDDPAYGLLVKRVIGLPGDKIRITADGQVLRNGAVLAEPYLLPDAAGGSAMPEITVAAGKLFVLGDHRGRSVDSRNAKIGQVSAQNVRGCVTQIVRTPA